MSLTTTKKRVFRVADLAARNATGRSKFIAAESFDEAILYIDVPVFTSGSFVFSIDASPDGENGTRFFPTGDATAAINATGKYVLKVPRLPKDFTVLWTAGPGNMQFQLDIELIKVGIV